MDLRVACAPSSRAPLTDVNEHRSSGDRDAPGPQMPQAAGSVTSSGVYPASRMAARSAPDSIVDETRSRR